jgi:TRAP-type C4-dicarboxylate transport system permease small subunit
MNTLLIRFYGFLAVLSACSMVAAFVTVMLQIASRQLAFNIPGLDAYAGYSIAAALFLALPETLRRGEHIRVTLVLQKAPAALRTALEYFSLGVAAALSFYLAFFACKLVWVSQTTHDVSQSADATPLWIPQLTMALGCIGLALAFAHALVARWQQRDFFPAASDDAAFIE